MRFRRSLNTADLCGANTDRGYNMTTSSGRPFWPAFPMMADIHIEDIANHLARECRFAGAIREDIEIYSVCQHSCLVHDNVPPEYRLEALLHDAPEYVFGDRIKPIKLMMTGAKIEAAEKRLDHLIRLKFGLPLKKTQPVREADYRAVLTERRDILHPDTEKNVDWGVARADPWPEKIVAWGVFKARDEFMRRFERLYRGQV